MTTVAIMGLEAEDGLLSQATRRPFAIDGMFVPGSLIESIKRFRKLRGADLGIDSDEQRHP